jgi:hypothetical protein
MRPLLTFAALAGILTLAACSPANPDPAPDSSGDDPAVSTPGIVTEVEGTSPLEDDPWVQAARAEDTGYLMAVNAMDFSIPEFTDTHSAASQQEFYDFFIEEYVDEGYPVIMFPGPSIRLPLEVTPNAAGDGADVLFCDASVDWAVSQEFPEPAYDLENGEEIVITVVTDDRGNLVFGSEDRNGNPCDATGAAVQRFDPAPVVPDGPISLDDVTPPNG